MTHEIKRDLESKGFSFLKGYLPGLTAYEISGQVGTVAELPCTKLVQQLRPKALSESEPNTYSGNFGLGRFPMHTDLAHWIDPPRYLMLRCLKGSANVATHILDSAEVVEEFGRVTLARTFVRPRRPTNGKNFILKLLCQFDEGKTLFRWDEIFIKPASQSSVRVFENISQWIAAKEYINLFIESAGDTLVIDNWRMLHGRSPILQASNSRHIERVYLGTIN